MTSENDEAYRQASERAQNIAMVSMGFINMVAGLASPRVWAEMDQMPTRDELLRCADAYIDALASVRPSHPERGSMDASKPHAIKLRKLLEAWTPSQHLPSEIVKCARELLSAFGIPEPPGGWDNFEGFDDE